MWLLGFTPCPTTLTHHYSPGAAATYTRSITAARLLVLCRFSPALTPAGPCTSQALPLAAVVHCGPHKLFCVHGGISPYIQKLHEINAVNRFVEEPTDDRVSNPGVDVGAGSSAQQTEGVGLLPYLVQHLCRGCKPDQRVWVTLSPPPAPALPSSSLHHAHITLILPCCIW